MRIAVMANYRTTFKAMNVVEHDAYSDAFKTAYRAGCVMGFGLVGLSLGVLQTLMIVYIVCYGPSSEPDSVRTYEILMDLVAGYGLGGSSMALFGRVGGGIYTKAADVGADLVGKTLKDLEEDDINNPGTIADNVGDNVGDIAGMGADLFGSLAESTCAALVVSSTSPELVSSEDALYFPLVVTSVGILASFVSVLFAHAFTITVDTVQTVLKFQLGISTILMTIALVPSMYILPEKFVMEEANGENKDVTRWGAFGCVMFGLWSGMIIGFITEYYTSNAYGPTLKLAEACEMGAAPNII